MGEEDTRRQALNVARMRLLGAEVDAGDDRLAHAQGRHQRGDARLGHQRRDHQLRVRHGRRAAPVPADGARVPAGDRRRGARAGARAGAAGCPTRSRPASAAGRTRSASSPPSSRTSSVRLVGFEAGGDGVARPAGTPRRSPAAAPGVLHGARSYLLQDDNGQTIESHSISAGLDYPGVGPEHAYLHDIGRAEYRPITDDEAMAAFSLLSRTEGIIPRSSRRTRWPAPWSSGASSVAGAGVRQSSSSLVRPWRQGRRDRVAVLRARMTPGARARSPLRSSRYRCEVRPMTALSDGLANARAEGRAALIGYLPVGYPTRRRVDRGDAGAWSTAASTSSRWASRTAIR